MKLPGIVSFRLRILFRGAFLLLALATVAMAVYLLWAEKELAYRNYRHAFSKTHAEIVARLHHPAGQLALLNPQVQAEHPTPLRPLLLPFASLDFDDRYKAQQAVEMSGCEVRYPPNAAICAAIGSNPWAGGFIYLTGRFDAPPLIAHRPGESDATRAHRMSVRIVSGEREYRWIAPFELLRGGQSPVQKSTVGRLTGFAEADPRRIVVRPDKDFRGWLWQNPQCADDATPCARHAFFSLRVPVEAWRLALYSGAKPVWPPSDLAGLRVHVQLLPPGDGAPLLDSDAPNATLPFTVGSLVDLLLPGETLSIARLPGGQETLRLTGSSQLPQPGSPFLAGLLRRLPVDGDDRPIEIGETVTTALGDYRIRLSGDAANTLPVLNAVASRVSWFVLAMLLGILLVWGVMEILMIRRIKELTRRAVNVSQSMRGGAGFERIELDDLRGRDELGLLAGALGDLLERVREDVARERIRTEQEKDLWHAVGHEIMSPLQSLMALHGTGHDESSRYIARMQQAVRILYGGASPSEAFQASTLRDQVIDLDAFLQSVADNAPCAGIRDVHYPPADGPLWVKADEYSLEDVVTHILRNADRHRTPGTPIEIGVDFTTNPVLVNIHNHGPAIPPELIDKIFEYGVSGPVEAAPTSRGQGLFVAKTYMAKMGGTIAARNEADGVSLILSLQKGSAPEE